MPDVNAHVHSPESDENPDGRSDDTVRRPAHSGGSEVTDKPAADFGERRRHPRSALKLQGRYMLSDGSEFPCETVDVFPGGIASEEQSQEIPPSEWSSMSKTSGG